MLRLPEWYNKSNRNQSGEWVEDECESLADLYINGYWETLKKCTDPRVYNHICIANKKKRERKQEKTRAKYIYEMTLFIHERYIPDPENIIILRDSFWKMSKEARSVVELVTSEDLAEKLGITKMDIDPYRISSKIKQYFGFPVRKWKSIRREIREMVFEGAEND